MLGVRGGGVKGWALKDGGKVGYGYRAAIRCTCHRTE